MTREEREAYMARIREASAADHRQMMNLLGIAALRAGANGRDPDAPNAANYDEAKARQAPRSQRTFFGLMEKGSEEICLILFLHRRLAKTCLFLNASREAQLTMIILKAQLC